MKTVVVGNLTISLASVIVLVSAIILSIVLMFASPYGFIASLGVLLGGTLAAYNVNCAQVGQCHTWAWILTSFYVVYAVFIVAMGLFFKNTQLLKNKFGSK